MKSQTRKPKRKRGIKRTAANGLAVPQLPSQELEELLRVADCLRLLKISRSTLWRWVRDGHLSKPLRLSANVIAWRRSAIGEFLTGRENS